MYKMIHLRNIIRHPHWRVWGSCWILLELETRTCTWVCHQHRCTYIWRQSGTVYTRCTRPETCMFSAIRYIENNNLPHKAKFNHPVNHY